MKESDLAQMMPPPSAATAALAAEAARAISGINAEGIASITKALGGMDATRLANIAAMQDAAKTLALPRTMVAPEVTAQIAESLRAATEGAFLGKGTLPNGPFAEALKGIQLPTFQFAKTLDNLKVATQFPPRIAETFKALLMPPAYAAGIREALAALPANALSGVVAPAAAAAVTEAAVIAETPAAAEVADEALFDLGELSAAERRELQKDVVDAIAALGTLVAILADNGRIELASATLAFVAILVSIYLRVTSEREP